MYKEKAKNAVFGSQQYHTRRDPIYDIIERLVEKSFSGTQGPIEDHSSCSKDIELTHLHARTITSRRSLSLGRVQTCLCGKGDHNAHSRS